MLEWGGEARWDGVGWGGGSGDVDNYSKTAQDALNGLAFHDDSQICDLISRKRYGRPALMIRITELEDKLEAVLIGGKK